MQPRAGRFCAKNAVNIERIRAVPCFAVLIFSAEIVRLNEMGAN